MNAARRPLFSKLVGVQINSQGGKNGPPFLCVIVERVLQELSEATRVGMLTLLVLQTGRASSLPGSFPASTVK